MDLRQHPEEIAARPRDAAWRAVQADMLSATPPDAGAIAKFVAGISSRSLNLWDSAEDAAALLTLIAAHGAILAPVCADVPKFAANVLPFLLARSPGDQAVLRGFMPADPADLPRLEQKLLDLLKGGGLTLAEVIVAVGRFDPSPGFIDNFVRRGLASADSWGMLGYLLTHPHAARDTGRIAKAVAALLAVDEPWNVEILLPAAPAELPEPLDMLPLASAERLGNDWLAMARALAVRPQSEAVALKLKALGFEALAASLLAPHAAGSVRAAEALTEATDLAPAELEALHARHGRTKLLRAWSVALSDDLRADAGVALLRDALVAEPESSSLYRALADLLERLGRYREWRVLVETVIAQFPDKAWAHRERARFSYETNDQAATDEALADWRESEASAIEVRRMQARHQHVTGDDAAATASWRWVAAHSGKASDHYQCVSSVFQSSDLAEAAAFVGEAAARYPGDARFPVKQAQIAERQGDYEAALRHFVHGFAVDRDSEDAAIGVARCLAYTGRLADLERWLTGFAQDDLRCGWVHGSRAFGHWRSGDPAAARAALAPLYAQLASFWQALGPLPATIWDGRRFVAHPDPEAARANRNFARLQAEVRAAGRVAIIGNAPSLIGSAQGAAIDAEPFVLRINDFRTIGHEADVGARNDLWYSSANRYARPDLHDPATVSALVYQKRAIYLPELDGFTRARLGFALDSPNASYLPPHVHILTERLVYPKPSAGFRMILLAHFLWRVPIVLYGFDFFSSAAIHYFDTGRHLRIGEVHARDFERDFVAMLADCFPDELVRRQ